MTAELRPAVVVDPRRTIAVAPADLRVLVTAAKAAERHGRSCERMAITTAYADDLKALVERLICAQCHGRGVAVREGDDTNMPRTCIECMGSGLA